MAEAPDLLGAALGAMVLTAVVTPLVGWVVLRRFRRAVRRGMGATASPGVGRIDRTVDDLTASTATAPIAQPPAPPAPASGVHAAAGALPVTLVTPRDPSLDEMVDHAAVRTIRRRMGATVAAYVASGLAYAVVAASVVLLSSDMAFLPRRTAALIVLYTWPVVPTVVAVGAARRRTVVAVWAAFVACVMLVTVGSGVSLRDLLVLIAVTVAPPALLLGALSGRRLRSVGPFLAPPVFVLSLGLLVWPWAVVSLGDAGFGWMSAVVVVALVVVAATAATVTYLWWSARSYGRRRVSDEMQVVSQWWFVATVWLSAFLVPAEAAWAAAVWVAYVVFRLVLRVAVRAIPRDPAGPRLLLLRTFGVARRSERMLRHLSAGWRHLGSIQLVAGIDLAVSTLEPHEFLDFLRGRLATRFVRTPQDLQRQLVEADASPDPDGRFRVTDLFCHDDTWRPVVQTLLRTTDAVLMDLRGFGAHHRGVVYELRQLVALADLADVVLVTDDTTDHRLLHDILTREWQARGAPVSSPLRVVRLGRDGIATVALLGLLTAATAPADRSSSLGAAGTPMSHAVVGFRTTLRRSP